MDRSEHEEQTAESQTSAASQETANELMDIKHDQEQRGAAWEQYQGYVGEAYQQANAERATSRQIAIDRYPDLTMVAQINLDPTTGETINGHDPNPEAQSHRDTEAAWQHYLETTPPEERFAIYEGGDGQFADRDQAIRERADAGLLLHLSEQAGVERASGEPTPDEELRALVEQGFSQPEAALCLTLRSIGARHVGDQDPSVAVDPAGEIYAQLAILGVDGFRRYSEEERARIQEQPEVMKSVFQEMGDKGRDYALEQFNPLLEQLGLPKFEQAADGSLRLPGISGEQLVGMSLGAPGRLGEMARADIELRDRHIFDTIADAVKAGKKPFSVYGGSHVVALRPALGQYLRKP